MLNVVHIEHPIKYTHFQRDIIYCCDTPCIGFWLNRILPVSHNATTAHIGTHSFWWVNFLERVTRARNHVHLHSHTLYHAAVLVFLFFLCFFHGLHSDSLIHYIHAFFQHLSVLFRLLFAFILNIHSYASPLVAVIPRIVHKTNARDVLMIIKSEIYVYAVSYEWTSDLYLQGQLIIHICRRAKWTFGCHHTGCLHHLV